MALGRFLCFFFATVLLGVLQLWILGLLVLTSLVPQPPGGVSLAQVLGDGGLFFFATTLTVSSGLTLLDALRPRVGDRDFTITLIVCPLVLFFAVTVYAAVHAKSFGHDPLPFQSHVLPQIACMLFALGYWFYVGIRTGWFKPAGAPDA